MTTKPAAPSVATAAPAPAGQVAIDRLTLRLPGQDAGFGRRVVERVGSELAERLPAGASGHYPTLTLRVQPRDLSEAGLSKAVVEALARALERQAP